MSVLKFRWSFLMLVLSFIGFVLANTEVTILEGWCDASVLGCFRNSVWSTEVAELLTPNTEGTFYVDLPPLQDKKQFFTRVCWSAAIGAAVDIGDVYEEGERRRLRVNVKHEGITTKKPPAGSFVEVILRVSVEVIETVPVQTAQLVLYATAIGVVAALASWHVI